MAHSETRWSREISMLSPIPLSHPHLIQKVWLAGKKLTLQVEEQVEEPNSIPSGVMPGFQAAMS
jgi:hypothetical protein